MEGEKFKPIDLTEENVEKLYEICKARPGTKDTYVMNIIENDTSGTAYLFDVDALEHHQKEIAYLFGQLAVVQEKQERLHSCKLVDVIKKYDGSVWTRDTAVLVELLHLGTFFDYAVLIHKIDDTHIAVLNTNLLTPTRSPRDPRYLRWWKEEKVKWSDAPRQLKPLEHPNE